MVIIGEIVKPQGIKGELKVKPIDQDLKRYENIKHLFLDNKKTSVLSISIRQDFIYVMLEGIDDRNKAEILRGKFLSVEKDDLPKLSEMEFYFEDIINAIVIDEDNKLIGELVDIEQYGAADVLSIRVNNRIYMIPFVDEIVKDVNTIEKKIVVYREKYDEVKICD